MRTLRALLYFQDFDNDNISTTLKYSKGNFINISIYLHFFFLLFVRIDLTFDTTFLLLYFFFQICFEIFYLS